MIHLSRVETHYRAEEMEYIPCPCCGSTRAGRGSENDHHYVKCSQCGMMTGRFASADLARIMWNHRSDALGHEYLLTMLHDEINADPKDGVSRFAVKTLNEYFAQK